MKKTTIQLLSYLSFILVLLFNPNFSVQAHSNEAESTNKSLISHEYDKESHPLEKTTLTILHDTHFHGNFGDPDAPENIANYFGLINQIRSDNPHSIMIGNGDDLATSVLSSTFNGEHIIDAFNAGKLDVNTYGNHEFDMGPEQVINLVEKSNFPWVSANVYDKRTNQVFGKEQGAEPFIIKEINGTNVGITGLINEEAPEITSMGENAQVINPVEAMTNIVPEMKEAGADIVIVSSHLASTDARLVAEQVDGIDLIVGDHAALANDTLEKINNTLLSFVGDEFSYLGEINLLIENGEITDFNYKRYSLEEEAIKEDFQPDDAVKAVMDDYNSQLVEQLDVVIGKTETELDVMKATQRRGETKIGNFVADAMKEYTNADAALVNGGGIRAERIFPVGSLTKRDIMDALPFTNYVVKLELNGQQIYDALENGVSGIEDGAGRFPQVSGIEYAFNPELPVGSRIVNVKINGEKLKLNKTYTLATVDFIAGGGDGYTSFQDAKVLLDANSGPLLSTLVVDHIKEEGTINPDLEERISIVTDTTSTDYEGEGQPNKEQKSAEIKPNDTNNSKKIETTYVVKNGDTLSHIGLQYGVNWKKIADYNQLENPHLILIGQEIIIPSN